MRYFLLFFTILFLNFQVFAGAKDGVMPLVSKQTPDYQNRLTQALTNESGLLTGKRGLGNVVKNEVGHFRLISCNGGIKDNNVFLMLEARLSAGWYLKKPFIPSEKNDSIISERILYPISAWDDKKTLDYQNDVYIALVYELKPETKRFDVKKNVLIEACQKSGCLTKEVPLTLSLLDDNQYPTDVCALMMSKMRLIPKPPKEGELQTHLIKIDEHHMQLVADFDKKIKRFNLQIEKDFEWQIVKKEIRGEKIHVLIKTDKNRVIGEQFNLKISLNSKWYDVTLPLEEDVYRFLDKKTAWFDVVVAGVMLFFLSPLFILFCLLPQTKDKLNKAVKKIALGTYGLSALLLLFVYMCPNYMKLFEVTKANILLSMGVLIWFIIRPKMRGMIALVAFLLWPKPYLVDVFYTLDKETLIPVFVFLVMTAIALCPFFFFKNMPMFFEALSKVKQYPYLLRFPQIVLFVWCVIVGVGGFFFNKQGIEDFERLKENHKAVYISVENGYSLTALFNKMLFMSAQKDGAVITLDGYSDRGQAFLQNNRLEQADFGLLYGKKTPYPIVIYEYTPFEKWGEYFKEVVLKPKESEWGILLEK